jgi:hypothetical protein
MDIDCLVNIMKDCGTKMISLYRYWYARRRLNQSYQTLAMMAPDVPPMVEAQHEMICYEVNYYKHQVQKNTIILLTLIVIGSIMYSYVKEYLNV